MRHVCLFTLDPGGGFGFPIVDDADVWALRSTMDGEGLCALGIAFFALTPDMDLGACQAALERSARLGATRANVRVLDPDTHRATDHFRRFANLAHDALHVTHTAVPATQLQALRPEDISYLQLCDGPLVASVADHAREGAFDRRAPGDGEFPLARLLALTAPDLPVSLEVPTASLRKAGIGARARCAAIVAATRKLLHQVEGG